MIEAERFIGDKLSVETRFYIIGNDYMTDAYDQDVNPVDLSILPGNGFVPGVDAGLIYAVPEPSSTALIGIGIVAALGYRWRPRVKNA
jgi:hypothetical protein